MPRLWEGWRVIEHIPAGNIFNLVLPESHIRVRVPQFRSFTNIKQFTPRLGMKADVLVVPTMADFEAGRDRAVDVARRLPAPPVDAAAALAGNWAGTLDYRDYGNDSRVTQPTLMTANGLSTAWTFDDGPVLRLTRMIRTAGQPFIMRHSYQLRPAARGAGPAPACMARNAHAGRDHHLRAYVGPGPAA